MSIHVALTHQTRYRYDRPVRLGPQVIRLRPAPHSRTRILSYALDVEPRDHFLNWQQDPQSNWQARLVFPEPTREFVVTVDLVADMAVINPFDFFLEDDSRALPIEYPSWLATELAPFLVRPKLGPLLTEWLRCIPEIEDAARRTDEVTGRPGINTIDFVVGLNRRLEQDIRYLIRMEPGVQTAEETLGNASGSCRDTAWLEIQILRHLGLAARFVSGYLIQLVADQAALDGPSGPTADFTDLHAWVEVYLPGAGWVGLDPTSGLLAGEGHIPLAATPDPGSAAPISGMVEEAKVEFAHEMNVTRVSETPRVTKPYTREQWKAIDVMGKRVDVALRQDDVRLTMGGEPTFVSIDDMQGEEWNTAAVGPMKRGLAATMIERLRDRIAPGGLLHYGQGKWYPGESLPRWALALYWRRDGRPIWQRSDLIAREGAHAAVSTADAQAVAEGIAQALGVDARCVTPAYEDPAAYALREQTLPDNVSAIDNRLEDLEERARLVRVFERGLGNPVGFVLPIQCWQGRADGRTWLSEVWSFRRKRLYLLPGDSPAGFRLPLESLPFLSAAHRPVIVPPDPFAPRDPLPDPRHLDDQGQPARELPPQPPPPPSVAGPVRTALTVELRGGILCVFMPPVPGLEDYLDLIYAVEETAARLGLPVHLEGYTPPEDPRVHVIKVTPDPGVIEVNVHPAASWRELVETTRTVYEEARLTRLGTEKFMLDGRHSGTGGGNHFVLGGATPADSPFLRRPDLLASMIRYWQRHPALSYLFSGLFIGPTSQAPRVDEARHETLYELELALAQIPDREFGPVEPWLVDRVFRNLLVDVSGNTHRSEICIDKLYSPDGPTGRLGLVELRGFEMPPHAEMSLVQQLLLRSLVAAFWRQPVKGPLVRWGTQLQDRFMLPHYIWKDLLDVIDDLRERGFGLDAEWFAPHFEFRFPVAGSIEQDGIELELRTALEPWHVMGETGAVGGTARYVDSSLERMQVRVRGMTRGRHVLAVNGVRVPLQPTGTYGEGVAGVRFRAWQPPMALQPRIGVHSPLVFDLVDTWSGRAVGGCTYHVSHPGGRGHDTFPVNANEAEARRSARFRPFGHTPGPSEIPPATPHPDYPHTLDLRLASVGLM